MRLFLLSMLLISSTLFSATIEEIKDTSLDSVELPVFPRELKKKLTADPMLINRTNKDGRTLLHLLAIQTPFLTHDVILKTLKILSNTPKVQY